MRPVRLVTELEDVGLRGADQVAALGRTLVVVPHPDDETLGCGGLLALLADAGMPVKVVLVSDGALSHPNSMAFPAPRLAALRALEMAEALRRLGLDDGALEALGWPDGSVPTEGENGFAQAVTQVAASIAAFGPRTVVLPWRRDPHPDHRAAHAIGAAACRAAAPRARRIEYAVWAPERGAPEDGPRPNEAALWRLDVSTVVQRKRDALAAHRSQLGQVVPDDPDGFTLPASMVARCAEPVETYCEPPERPSS